MQNGEKFLTVQEVGERCFIGTSAIYRKMREGDFPLPLQFSGRCVRWPESEIMAYLNKIPRSHGNPRIGRKKKQPASMQKTG